MKKFTEYIGSQFGNPHGAVGTICCIIMNVINRAMYRKVFAAVNTGSDSKVLDIGYGNGYLLSRLYKKNHGILYGIDVSEDMLKIASKRNKKGICDGRIKLFLGDCCELKFDDKTFDFITSVNTIYFWNNTLKGLKEIYRTLGEQGIFLNVVYSKEWLKKLSYTKKGFRFFEKEEYINLGKQAGFSKVIVEEIINGKSYFIRFVK